MLNHAPLSTSPITAGLPTDLASTQVRIPQPQARLLNLQPGQIVPGEVVIKDNARVLLVRDQQLPLPARVSLPAQPLTLQVKSVDGQQVLTLVEPKAQQKTQVPVTTSTQGVSKPAQQVIQLTLQQGRQLNLVAGQVVQATIRQTADGATLRIGANVVALAERRGIPAQSIELAVTFNRGQFTLATQVPKPPLPSPTLLGVNTTLPQEQLGQQRGKSFMRLSQSQVTQLGLRSGLLISGVVIHRAEGSELKLPAGSLPLAPPLVSAQPPVPLKLVSQMGGSKYFLVPAYDSAPSNPKLSLEPMRPSPISKPGIPISPNQAKQLLNQQGSNIHAKVINAGTSTQIEVGTNQFRLPKGVVLSQPPVALVVERRGSNYFLQPAPASGFVANNHSGDRKMLTAEPMNLSMRPNIVYVEGAAAGMRINPEQARVLGLREGQVINAVVAQRPEGNLLLVGNQQLQIPARLNLPQGPAAFLVSVVNGSVLLSLVDPSSGNKLNPRGDADARFGRLLGHAGGLHLGRLFSPGSLTQILGSTTTSVVGQSLQNLLLNSREITAPIIRRSMENFGLFTESEIRHTGMAPANQGIKSALIGLRALFQGRQLDTTLLSGAIDELEARQIESLAQQVAGKTSLSWVIPFADQWPVYIRLSQDGANGIAESSMQKTWSVDLEAGIDAQTSMSANIRVDASKQIEVRIWLPSAELFTIAQANREELVARLREHGVTLVTLSIFPTSRIPITDDVPEQRVGLNIDA